LGGWVFDFLLELGAASGVAGAFTEDIREVATASVVEVAVKELKKEPKQISMGLVRMSAILVGKTTPDRATILHNEFPISPNWRANFQG
jgi:hypothetical protein